MSRRRVVVTGLGIISPVGNDVSTAWNNIVAGRSGIRKIDLFDVSPFSSQIGGTIIDFDPTAYIPLKDVKKMDPFVQYGMAAGIQAIEDSGFEVTEANAHRIGVNISSGIGGIGTIERAEQIYSQSGPRKISPFFVPSCIINMVSGNLSIRYGLKGPNLTVVTACATGTHSLGLGARMIQYGDADIMVVGGAEMAMTPTGLGGFSASRALSCRNDDPEGASRPWDRDRDGFVLASGAGVLVLEEYEMARKRGAKIYAEVVGFGMNGDAYHITLPSENGAGAAQCIRICLQDAGVNPDQVDYINAHGTSTPAGDIGETMGIKSALGDAAQRVAISSTKSMTGHLLGAAGGVESIFSVLAIRDQIIPPTINLENQDPECDLDYTPNIARSARVEYALSNSFGFGGTNGCLLFKKL